MAEKTNSKPPVVIPSIPDEFQKIIKDFIHDILTTFPEYEFLVKRWWVTDTEGIPSQKSLESIFQYCLSIYPERFFDILYKNQDIFSEGSNVNTEFLPGISFKYLWSCDISENTRETIWKYLQLIILSVVNCVDNKEAFGDTSKMLESINEEEFRNKLQETMEEMQKIFQTNESSSGENPEGNGINMKNMPSAEDIHSHITGMLDGKLGNLAREIAEETAGDLDIDMENITDVKDVFQNLFNNPGKLMNLVKNVGEKLDSRMKSGEINQSELLSEASEIMNKMKNMPGMGNIQEMLSKIGMQMPNMEGLGRNAKMDISGMENKLKQMTKMAQMKERMQKKAEQKKQAAAAAATTAAASANTPSTGVAYTDEQLVSLFSDMEKPMKTPRSSQEKEKEKDKKKKKKKA